MNDKKCPYSATPLTMSNGAPVVDNENSKTAGKRGPLLAEDLWLNEKLADLNREIIPERRMHAKGSGAVCQGLAAGPEAHDGRMRPVRVMPVGEKNLPATKLSRPGPCC